MSLHGVGSCDGNCAVVEMVVGGVTSSGWGEGDGLWVVVESGCEDEGVGCEVWDASDGGMEVDTLVGYPSSPIRNQITFHMHSTVHTSNVDFLTWTDRAAGVWELYEVFTVYRATLRYTEHFSILTEAGDTRITIFIPPITIVIYLSSILTCDLHWNEHQWWLSKRACGATLVWNHDGVITFWNQTLFRATKWQSFFTSASDACISLPRLPLVVVDIFIHAPHTGD